MKSAIVSLAFISFLNANEVMRVESMLLDISNLRAKYEHCQQELEANKVKEIVLNIDIKKEKNSTCQKAEEALKESKNLLKQEQEKNRILTQKIDYYSNEKPKNSQINQKISELEKELKEKDKILKIKEPLANSNTTNS